MNTYLQFKSSIFEARAVVIAWGKFRYFVREPGPRKPTVPLALAMAFFEDIDHREVKIREAIRVARQLGFEVDVLSGDRAAVAWKRWAR